MHNALLLGNKRDKIEEVFGSGRRERLASVTNLYPQPLSAGELADHREELKETDVVFSTWGMPLLTPEQLDVLPNLKALFYAAGTVKAFAAPLLERGIILVNAADANAIPVAEMVTSEVLLALKGFFRNCIEAKDPEKRLARSCFTGPGVYGESIALLGAGRIGRSVIRFLKPHCVRILVYDPYLSSQEAAELGVETVSLPEAFSRAFVVSNHLPNLPSTQRLITPELLASMRRDAVFINSGRGASVDEPGMCRVLAQRPDLTALLDVTAPEPPEKGSPLYALPNVVMTSHVAGAIHDETRRMADLVLEEFQRWERGEDLHCRITAEMLATMA